MKEGSDEESDEGGNNEPKMGLYVRRYDVCLTVPPNLHMCKLHLQCM